MNTNELGFDLAKKLAWNGVAILQVARAALEDANFHTESRIIHALIEMYDREHCEEALFSSRTSYEKYSDTGDDKYLGDINPDSAAPGSTAVISWEGGD